MKRIVPILSVIALLLMLTASVALAADSPPPPTTPDVIQLAISIVMTWVVVNGLKALAENFHIDLNGWATVIALTVTGIVVFSLNSILALMVTINPDLGPKIQAVFEILVILLGAKGLKRTELKVRGDV